MSSDPITVVRPAELEPVEEPPGVVRSTAFQTDNNVMARVRVAPGITSDWHHHCDRHVFGYVVTGTAGFEYGPDGTERTEIEAGGFVHIPPRTIHRDVNPAGEEQVWILNFVGSGPLIEYVDGPEPE